MSIPSVRYLSLELHSPDVGELVPDHMGLVPRLVFTVTSTVPVAVGVGATAVISDADTHGLPS